MSEPASEIPVPLVPSGGSPRLLERECVSDIIHLASQPVEFLIEGFLIDGTHGMLAGPEKSLKSYIGTFIDLAVISGQPLFGEFRVMRRGPVVAYIGEGGRIPYLRRVKRIARAMGVSRDQLSDYHVITQTAPIDSAMFQETLERDLTEVGPVLVRIDPYYAYHGSSADPRNLHQEGALLNLVSEPVNAHEANLLISNHFNQNGTGLHLKRITMAGAAEWCDSWLLLAKTSDRDQDVPKGRFKLKLVIGSRQWGGSEWELCLDIGFYDNVIGEHNGDVSWNLIPTTTTLESRDTRLLWIEHETIKLLIEHPWELTKSNVTKRIPMRDQDVSSFLSRELERTAADALIVAHKVKVKVKGGAIQERDRLGLNAGHPEAPDDYPEIPDRSLPFED
jgi:hypothetical protein